LHLPVPAATAISRRNCRLDPEVFLKHQRQRSDALVRRYRGWLSERILSRERVLDLLGSRGRRKHRRGLTVQGGYEASDAINEDYSKLLDRPLPGMKPRPIG